MTLKPASALEAPDKTIVSDEIMTGDQLFSLDIGSGELIEGVFIEMPPPGFWHGYIEFNFGSILHTFVRKHNLGYIIGGEAGVYTHRNPDTVRGVNVAFISHERMAQVKSESYLDVAPELIVEILSPGDRWDEVNDKLTEYFAIGVQMVWVVDPKRKQFHLYRALTEVEILTAEDDISGGEVLSGFSVGVAELFGTAS
jgi:Uma2 family endonuclease